MRLGLLPLDSLRPSSISCPCSCFRLILFDLLFPIVEFVVADVISCVDLDEQHSNGSVCSSVGAGELISKELDGVGALRPVGDGLRLTRHRLAPAIPPTAGRDSAGGGAGGGR
jgi:hypothetical protein